MSIKRWFPIFCLSVVLILAACGGSGDDQTESPETRHNLVNGSVTIKLPQGWVVEQDDLSANRFEVLSDAKLREEQDPTEGAMGRFTIESVVDSSSPTEMLAAKLEDAGGAPEGSEIESLEINGRPAARMAAMDEMFGQRYLWHATLIQFEDDVIVYVDFTALGKYEDNDVIDAVIKTISVDSAAFNAIEGDA
jgi:hypothetical protein